MNHNRKNILLVVFLILITLASAVKANDGVYYLSGNFLVPVKENDIRVTKEILTINIGKDSLATVDVYYELMNDAEAKNVTMAFEADAPYNTCSPLNRKGVHPYISNFSVTMNDTPLPYSNAVIAAHYACGSRQVDFTPLDLSKWQGNGEAPDSVMPSDNVIYNAELDSITEFAYGYFFDAPFRKGLNTVHHTYTFLMSKNVMERFNIHYCLTPATRWSNHKVDDFTLRINAEDAVRDFCMADTLFFASPFTITGGEGEIHQMTVSSGEHYAYVSLGPGATLQWHATDFCPKAEMTISSPELLLNTSGYSSKVVIDATGNEYRFIGDCGNTYYVGTQDYCEIPKTGCRVVEYTPDRGQGWIHPKHPSRINIRKAPTTSSAVIGTMISAEGELPDTYPCLGHVQEKKTYNWWFKIKYGKKVGYVLGDLVEWDAINTF